MRGLKRLSAIFIVVALMVTALPLVRGRQAVRAQTDEERVAELKEALDAVEYPLTAIKTEWPVKNKQPIDPDAVTTDMAYPSKREVNITLAGTLLTVETSNTTVVESKTYRGHVFRPLPGSDPVDVMLTARLSDSKNKDLYAEKEIGTIKVLPLTMEELKRTDQLMNDVQAQYFDGIRGANESADKIEHDLQRFTEAQRAEDGVSIKWIRKRLYNNRQDVIPEYFDENSFAFKTSHPHIIGDGGTNGLKLIGGKPEYDTEVTISSVLTHQEFGRVGYLKRLDADDMSEAAELIRSFNRRPVSTTVTVLGLKGPDPNPPKPKTVKGTFTVTGSKLIETAADHDTCHEEWFKVDFEVDPSTTLEDLTKMFLDKPSEGRTTVWNYGFLSSIAIEGKGENIGGVTNGTLSSWMWYNKSELGQVGAGDYFIQEGDQLEWKFENDPAYPYGVTQETADPPYALNPTPDYWTSFCAHNNNNAVKEIPSMAAPVSEQRWMKQIGELSPWGINLKSDFLILGEDLYFASDAKLYRVDRSGNVTAEVELRDFIDSTCRLAYDNGLIVVPLSGGALQAVEKKTLKTIWVAESLPPITTTWEQDPDDPNQWNPVRYPLQNLSAAYIEDGVVYSVTCALKPDWTSAGGRIRAVDMATGETIWCEEENGYGYIEEGYYWAGPIKVGDYLVLAGDSGNIRVRDASTGVLVNETGLGTGKKVRSAISRFGDTLYCTTYDGELIAFSVDENSGAVTIKERIQFSIKSTSTPAIHNGKAYVGGLKEAGDWQAQKDPIGAFLVIDLATKETIVSYETVGEVQSSPLVVVGKEGKTFVYFTANHSSNGLFCYDGEKVQEVYLPENDDAKNYGVLSPVVDGDGTVYWANDSGYVFAIVEKVVVPTLVLNDDGETTDEIVRTVLEGLIKGNLLKDGILVVKDDPVASHADIAEKQFAKDRVVLIDVTLVDEEGNEGGIVEDGTIRVAFDLSDAYLKDTEKVQFYRLNPDNEAYEPVDAATYDAATRKLTVDFDHFSAYAIVATVKEAPVDPPVDPPVEPPVDPPVEVPTTGESMPIAMISSLTLLCVLSVVALALPMKKSER